MCSLYTWSDANNHRPTLIRRALALIEIRTWWSNILFLQWLWKLYLLSLTILRDLIEFWYQFDCLPYSYPEIFLFTLIFTNFQTKNLFDHKHCSLANRSLSLLWISLKRAAWKKIRVHHWRLHLICTEILHHHINSQLIWGLFHTDPCSLQHLQFSGFCLLIVRLMWC